jgi:hypothetical protein
VSPTDPALEKTWPGLRFTRYDITSPKTRTYNCIAWAAHDDAHWWDPTHPGHWPDGVPRALTVEAFVAAYGTVGYEPCADGNTDPDHEKVALFADGLGTPTHAARQLPNGRWTSKLGGLNDIEHELAALEGAAYGRVVRFLRRPRSKPSP